MSRWTLSPIERARFLDGEGSPAERAERAADLLRDPDARTRVDRHRDLLAAIGRGRAAPAVPTPPDLLARVRAALAADRAAGFPSTGAGDSLPRVGRWAAIGGVAAAVVAGVFVFARGGDPPPASASSREVRLAAEAFRAGFGRSGGRPRGGTCDERPTDPSRFPLVANGELAVSECAPSSGSESVALVERAGDPKGRRGLVIVPQDGKSTATDVGYTRVGDVVVFDVNYGRARYFLATSWASVDGTTTCAACHGPERAAHPARNPHRIFERPLGTAD